MGRSKGERSAQWPRNVLRTIAYVAGRGVVGRSELSTFQDTLPSTAWGELEPQNGWQPVKPVLKWARVPLADSRALTLRAILGRLLDLTRAGMSHDDRDLTEDLRFLVSKEPAPAMLETTLSVPRTELAVQLGKRRTQKTLSAYRDALSLCGDAAEQRRLGAMLDLGVAARELRRTIEELHPERLYEAAGQLPEVARAVLTHGKSVRLRQERLCVVFAVAPPQSAYRLFLCSRMSKQDLADALGIPSRLVRRATTSLESVDLRRLDEVAEDLRRVARARR